jgi:hypothetical protein
VRRLGLAATSGCDRARVLVRQGADLSKIAQDFFGIDAHGISAAALTTGNQQEASLLRAGAAPLIELLSAAGRLLPGEVGFLDIRSLPKARQSKETLRLFGQRLLGGSPGVHLLAQPTFTVTIWGRRQTFRADFAVMSTGSEPSLGEKKSFHDFNADTDQPAMRALLDQGGAYYALADVALRQDGQAAAADQLVPVLDAVLRGPRIYRLPVADERDRTLRMLSSAYAADLDDVAADAARAAGATTLDAAFVEALGTNRGKHCASCPFRNKCRDDAYSTGDLSIVSTSTRPVASVAGTARRAASIVAGATPPARHERDLALQAAATRAELQGTGWTQRRFSA